MDKFPDSPDRRFWTTYDHFMLEQEARALRRAEIAAMMRRVSQHVMRRMRVALARAGRQPPKGTGARTATVA